MKLVLFLITLAGFMFWASFTLEQPGQTPAPGALAPPVNSDHAPVRRDTPQAQETTSIDAAAPPLFRVITAPADLALQPGQNFALIGLAGDSAGRTALLRDLGDQRVYRLRDGDSVADWSVIETNPHCVVLSRQRLRRRFCLS